MRALLEIWLAGRYWHNRGYPPAFGRPNGYFINRNGAVLAEASEAPSVICVGA